MGPAEATVRVGRPPGFVNFAGCSSVFQERWEALKSVCVIFCFLNVSSFFKK